MGYNGPYESPSKGSMSLFSFPMILTVAHMDYLVRGRALFLSLGMRGRS